MSNSFYELYRSKVFELAKTMVIKFDDAAVTINEELSTVYGLVIDEFDKPTWKYYLNLAGEYHSFDTLMQIPSLDNPGNTIDFTKANLAANRVTRAEYFYGSRFYKRLVEKYPDQEMLILGILNPVDIDTAISAKDGTILTYNKKLVEENETNLIPELETWIFNFIARWHNSDYVKVDNLYLASMLGILFLNLPQAIMNIRLKNTKTEYVHSYHIREYLESHGHLAPFLPYLTTKQALWLYRNILYVHRNSGKRETFKKLVDILLTERNLPLVRYDLRHTLGDIDTDLQASLAEYLLLNPLGTEEEWYDIFYRQVPDVIVRRHEINFIQTGTGSNERSLEYIIGKESEETPIGVLEEQKEIIDTKDKMIKLFGNRLPTKVLESSVIDTTDSVTYPLADVLLNHWIYYSTSGDYLTTISVTNPSTGERLFINAKNALILYMYSLQKGFLVDDVNAGSAERTYNGIGELGPEILTNDNWTLDYLNPVITVAGQSALDAYLLANPSDTYEDWVETLDEIEQDDYFDPGTPLDISDDIPQVAARLIRRDVSPLEADLRKVIINGIDGGTDSVINNDGIAAWSAFKLVNGPSFSKWFETLLVQDILDYFDPSVANELISVGGVSQDVINDALAVEYELQSMSTPDAFYEACTVIQNGLMRHREIYSSQERSLTRGMVEGMISLFYEDRLCDLVDTPTTYTSWIAEQGYDFTTMTPELYRHLSQSIVEKITGAGENTSKLLREMHRAMIDLMRGLSSYSVQYIRSINNSKTLVIDWPTQRIDNDLDSFSSYGNIKLPIVEGSNSRMEHFSKMEFELMGDDEAIIRVGASAREFIDIDVSLELEGGDNVQHMHLPLFIVSIKPDSISTTPLDTAIVIDDVPDYTYPTNDFYP